MASLGAVVRASDNPFSPTFGVSPPLLVGRDDLLEDFGDALDGGPGSPGRSTLYTGARGVGKTVMLTAVENQARQRGWLVISETATSGLVDRLVTEHLPALLAEHDPDASKRRLVGLTGGAPGLAGGATWENRDAHAVRPGLRNQIALLTDILRPQETGLLITIDEVQKAQVEEIGQVCVAIQHAFREEREVAFAVAGLPSAVSDLLSEKVPVITFLRRPERHVLGRVNLDDVATAISNPVHESGRSITDEACLKAARATDGYPFMIQLVGRYIWAHRWRAKTISLADVEAGIAKARRKIGDLVHSTALNDVSKVGRTFLVNMAKDDGPSQTADIAKRMGVSTNYAGQYRLRLIEAELIRPASHGSVDFTLPGMREYLRSHAASLVEFDQA